MEYYDVLSFLCLVFTEGGMLYQILLLQLEVNTSTGKLTMT